MNQKIGIGVCWVLCVSALVNYGMELNVVGWDLAYQSRAVAEGRLEIKESGVAVGGVDVSSPWLSHRLEYRFGDSVAFKEASLYTGIGQDWHRMEIEFGVAGLWWESSDEEERDIEFSISFAYDLLGNWDLFGQWVYGVDSGGSFIICGFRYEEELRTDRLLGWFEFCQHIDSGYAMDGFDGWNHFEVGTGLIWSLRRGQIELSLHKTFSQDGVKKEGGENLFWISLGYGSTF